jgi:hypothetical protein
MVIKNYDNDNIDEWFFNLDDCVISALNLFIDKGLPSIDFGDFKKPLVVGSGNAAVTGKIILSDKEIVSANESNYEKMLDIVSGIDGAVLISASGEKHAPIIAEKLKVLGIKVKLFTCNNKASSIDIVGKNDSYVFPSQGELFTYNTSTYFGMIFAKTKENPKVILDFIKEVFDKRLENLIKEIEKYDSYYIILPEKFENLRDLFLTKFDELTQPNISGRVFSPEQTKHAKNIIYSPKELIVGLGYSDTEWEQKKRELPIDKRSDTFNIPIFENIDSAGISCLGYYFIGKIQRYNPPWFKEGLIDFCKRATKSFNKEISPFVIGNVSKGIYLGKKR